MRTTRRGYCLLLFALAALLVARPCRAQPDCDALKRDPPPALNDSPASSKQITDCAYLLTNQGDYRRAQVLFQRALEMAGRRGDPASRAVALAGLGLTLGTLGQADRAEPMLTESYQISETLHDSDGMAEALSQLGHLRSQQSRYEESRAYHLRSLALWRSIDDHKGVAVALNNVGSTYRAVGDNTTGLEYFQQSLDELERIGDRRRSATVLDNIGRIRRTLGDYAAGLELSRKALAIRESLDDPEGMSRSLNSLSECYRAQGAYAAALDALQRSLQIRMRIGYVLAIAEGQNNIAVVYEAQGNYPQAIAYLRKSLALNTAQVHSQSLAAEIYTHLGEIYAAQGKTAQAIQWLKQTVTAGLGAALTLQTADAQLALARVYIQSGRLTLASSTLQQVLRFREATGDRSGRAEALIEAAEIERRRGRAAPGLALAAEARDMATAMETPEVRWMALTAVGRMYASLKRPAEAAAAFDAAMAIVEDMRVLNAGGEESRSRFFANRQAPYQARIALALATGDRAEGFHVAERSKARVLLEVIHGDRLPITKAMTDPERRQEVDLRTALTSANSELLFAARSLPRDETRVTALQRKRDQRRGAYEDFQAGLYAAHPGLRASRADLPAVRATEAQRLLPDDTAIVEFVAGPTRTSAFVVTAAGLRSFTLAVPSGEIGRQVDQFRDQLADRDLRAAETARRLYDVVLGPIRSTLAGKTSLVVVPDGFLWNLPFQALRDPAGRYVIESAAVSYAPSVTVLRETMRTRDGRTGAATLLGFGNPTASPEPAADNGEPRRDATGSLPETEREVRQIAPLYGPGSRVYVGADAREDRWKAEAPSYGIVHLATHGVLDNASPLYSHLVLAPPLAGGTDDGLLEGWEIMNTPLHADLVILSACETARGRVAPGEGVIGLMWAVFVAGSPATLVSQWRVDSASSTALMVAFHREWRGGQRGVSKARALQQASLEVLRTPGRSHPFYWAGFILAGDSR